MISEQNSQEEEGFITAKLVQKVSEVDDIRDSQGKQCKPFSAFCMAAGHGPLRLQLPKSIQTIDEFQIQQDPSEEAKLLQNQGKCKGASRNNSFSTTPQHPYRIYEQNSTYQLVYSRSSSEQPIMNEFQYIRNEIILQTAQKSHDNKNDYDEKVQVANKLRNPYSRLLRSFDYSLIKQMPRNQSTTLDHAKSQVQLLAFDSRFESGNLSCAYNKTGTHEYHLFIQNDTNSYGYNQWFYFSLSNIKKDTEYTFVVVNFKKKHSFFKYGYKPMIFSLKKYQQNNNQNGWYRGGHKVEYQESHITTSKFFKFYKLTFTLKFKYDNDYILIGANLPYSFTKLANYLQRFTKQFNISCSEEQISSLKVTGLGRTFCGNNLPEIKLTPNQEVQIRKSKSPTKNKKKSCKDKKMIILLARQHPGQTVSSFLMQNILQHLSTFGYEPENQQQKEDKQKVKYLLKNYTIVIFPMINIDGVIYGNSRCDITGMDLNRRWKNPSKVFHPQLFNIKNKIQSYARKYEIVGCFDLHGHSKLYNVFCYSCKINPITCRILPYIISKETNKFYFPSCTFGITRYKSTTARAAMFKIIENQNVLTIQSSYFGYVESSDSKDKIKLSEQVSQKQKKKIQYFQPKTFAQIARGIINGLQIFLNKSKMYSEAENQIKSQIDELLHLEKVNQENQASGSESDPQGDEIDFEIKIHTILGKEFLQQATSFMPAQQENIDIYAGNQPLTPQYQPNQTLNVKNLKTQERDQLNQKLSDSIEKNKVNKIRITKIKAESSDRKNLSTQKLQNDQNSALDLKMKATKPKFPKKDIQFSFHKNFKQTSDEMSPQKKFNSTHQQRPPNSSDRLYSQSNQRVNFGIRKKQEIKALNETIEGHAKFPAPMKDYDCGDLIIFSAQSKQMLKDEKSNLLQRSSFNPYAQIGENDFFLKFQRFFPSQAVPNSVKKEKLSFLQQSIYKDDKREILNTLMENKKRLDRQKMQREIEKSNVSVKQKQNANSNKKYNPWRDEREVNEKTIGGVVGCNGRRRPEIVDFKTFKDRDKLKMQVRQANFAYTKYMKKDLV